MTFPTEWENNPVMFQSPPTRKDRHFTILYPLPSGKNCPICCPGPKAAPPRLLRPCPAEDPPLQRHLQRTTSDETSDLGSDPVECELKPSTHRDSIQIYLNNQWWIVQTYGIPRFRKCSVKPRWYSTVIRWNTVATCWATWVATQQNATETKPWISTKMCQNTNPNIAGAYGVWWKCHPRE